MGQPELCLVKKDFRVDEFIYRDIQKMESLLPLDERKGVSYYVRRGMALGHRELLEKTEDLRTQA